jgi:NAD+ diphosphatase
VSALTSITYTGSRLDRAGAQRKDAASVASMLADPAARVVPVRANQSLVLATEGGVASGRAGSWSVADLSDVVGPAEVTWVLLGLDAGVPMFAADVTDVDDVRLSGLGGGAVFQDLRQVGSAVASHDAATMAYARGILAWHRRHRYCGTCGSETESRDGGHMRLCTNPDCAAETYPRVDPAVIMLVERPPTGGRPATCLLGRSGRFPPGGFSTLAGFVEPGESLEEAVAREVMEEVGVHVTDVSYRASQPWPFPSSLMVGFRATAASEAIVLDPSEIEEARWFTAEEIAGFGEWGDAGARFRLPRRDSIARALVEEWLAEVRGSARA